jgi:OFA family oxalate/formate antiporter-like MFS transporter
LFAFSIFIALETWLTPIQGWFVDILGPRRGPKLVVAAGGVLVAAGWIISSMADSLEMLYLGAVIGGTGGGGVYATSVGHAVKWFPDRRGLAVGLTAAGYGAGAALTVIPVRYVIDNSGYVAHPFGAPAWGTAGAHCQLVDPDKEKSHHEIGVAE